MVCHQKGFIQDKEMVVTQGVQTWKAMCAHCSECQDGEALPEGKRTVKGEGAVTTIALL